MGSSYRSDLRNGYGPRDWQEKLEKAVGLIEDVADDVGRTVYDTGQFDNAADEGRLQERLRIAADLVRHELPKESA